MTPLDREIRKKQRLSIKTELSLKLSFGDLTQLAEQGDYHYNSYRLFLSTKNDFWSEGIYREVTEYFKQKENVLSKIC